MQSLSNKQTEWQTLMHRVPLMPLMIALLVAMPLGVVALYYAPYPVISSLFLIWLVLLSLGMLLLFARWGIEQVPSPYLRVLLSVATAFVLNATFHVGALVFNYLKWPSANLVMSSVTLSFGCLALFALLYDRRTSPMYRAFTSTVGILAQIAAFVLLAMLFGVLIPDKASALEEQSRHGPAAPWSFQLSIAKQEAAKRNTVDAVLVGITASTVYARNSDYNTALNTRFYFVTPAGDRFKVVFNDINPAKTVQILEVDSLDPQQWAAKPTQEQLQQLPTLRDAVSYIKLSPRDALEKTVSEISPVAQLRGKGWTDPWVELHLRSPGLQPLVDRPQNVPATWVVEHVIVAGVDRRSFELNASTGEIMTRTTHDP